MGYEWYLYMSELHGVEISHPLEYLRREYFDKCYVICDLSFLFYETYITQYLPPFLSHPSMETSNDTNVFAEHHYLLHI